MPLLQLEVLTLRPWQQDIVPESREVPKEVHAAQAPAPEACSAQGLPRTFCQASSGVCPKSRRESVSRTGVRRHGMVTSGLQSHLRSYVRWGWSQNAVQKSAPCLAGYGRNWPHSMLSNNKTLIGSHREMHTLWMLTDEPNCSTDWQPFVFLPICVVQPLHSTSQES